MSRSNYSEDGDDTWQMIRWSGAVKSALNGKRGQAFLREMAAAMDAMPVRELIASALVTPEGACCAMGSVAQARGCDVSQVDPEDPDAVATIMGISPSMCREIAFNNDDDFCYRGTDDPAERWQRMRRWIDSQLIPAIPLAETGA